MLGDRNNPESRASDMAFHSWSNRSNDRCSSELRAIGCGRRSLRISTWSNLFNPSSRNLLFIQTPKSSFEIAIGFEGETALILDANCRSLDQDLLIAKSR